MGSKSGKTVLKQLPLPSSLTAHYERFIDRLCDLRANRRSVLLGIAGVTVGMPLVGALARAAFRFTAVATEKQLKVLVGGNVAWQVNTAWFDGAPRLSVKQFDGYLRAKLSNANFPGTDLAADFDLIVKLTGAEWIARLTFSGLGFAAEFPFERWLLGYQRAAGFIAIRKLAFRKAHEVRFDQLSGPATIGPDWIFDMLELDSSLMRIGTQHTSITSLRIELPSASQEFEQKQAVNADNLVPRLHIWPNFGGEAPLTVVSLNKTLVLPPEQAKAFISCSRQSTLLMIEHEAPQAQLVWHSPGLKKVAFPVHGVTMNALYAGTSPSVSGTATLSGATWHHDEKFAAELTLTNEFSSIDLSNQPEGSRRNYNQTTQSAPTPAQPQVHRFVVSIPGCDAAMFVQRAWPVGANTDLPLVVGTGLFDFGKHDIDLDPYDLILKRATDALALTVRFRNIHLVHTRHGWQLIGQQSGSLIEFDFGSQHLLEEAIYIADWCDGVAKSACQPSKLEPLAIPDEIAALAMLSFPLGTEDLDSSPVNRAQLAQYTEAKLGELLDYLHADLARLKQFNVFRADSRLRAKIAGKVTPGPRKALRIDRARASHLTFDFNAPAGIMFTVDELLAWAVPSPRQSERHHAGPATYVARLAQRAARSDQVDFVKLDGQDNDPNAPYIERPLSLAQSDAPNAPYATAIEVPAKLVMSPIAGDQVVWTGSGTGLLAANTHRNELWSVRITGAKIRAIYTPDARRAGPGNCAAWPECDPCTVNPARYQVDVFKPPRPYAGANATCEFRASLDARDRHEIVALSSFNGFASLCGSAQVQCQVDVNQPGKFISKPIDAALLQLTSMGANFKYKGRWDPPAGASGALSVMKYDHHGQLGRDILARVEYKGFLFPIGHPAILVKLTERRFCFETSPTGKIQLVARLVQRFFIHVPKFTRAFPAVGQPNEQRLWGHAAIFMDEFTTPDLADPTGTDCSFAGLGQSAFWPRNLCGALIEFAFGEPGTQSAYTAPLVFVDNNVAHAGAYLKLVIDAWRARTAGLLATPADQWPGATAQGMATVKSGRLPYIVGLQGDNANLETDRIILDVQTRLDEQAKLTAGPNNAYRYAAFDANNWIDWGVNARMEAQKQPPFYPVRRRSRIKMSKLAVLNGAQAQTYLIEFDPVYGTSGLAVDSNAGQIFARFVALAPQLDFSSNTSKSGGFANPSTSIIYLSAKRGPLGGALADLIALGTASPSPNVFKALAGGVSKVEITNAHSDNFVPAEFFSTFIGDAKLLGVVRIADIIQAALASSGTAIPTINTESLFDFAEDALRPIVDVVREQLKDVIGNLATLVPSAAVAARIRPGLEELDAKAAALGQLLAARPVNGAQLLAQAGAFGNAMGKVAHTIEGIANEPELLLPPELAETIARMKLLFTQLQQLNFKQLLIDWLTPIATEFIQTVLTEQLAKLYKAAGESPELRAMYEMARAVQEQVALIERVIASAKDTLAADLNDALDRLFGMIEQFYGMAALLQASVVEVQQVVAEIKKAVTEFAGTYTTIDPTAIDVFKVQVASFQVDISKTLGELERDLGAHAALPADQRAAAERLLANARQAASNLSEAVNDQLRRLQVLADPALENKPRFPDEPPPPRLGAFNRNVRDELHTVRYIAAAPATVLLQLTRVTELVQALVDYANQAGVAGTWCEDQIKALVNAFTAYIGNTLNQGGLPQVNLDDVVARLALCATRLGTIAASPAAGQVPAIRQYLDGMATNLTGAADAARTLIARLRPGATPPLFDLTGVCATAPDAICKEAKKVAALLPDLLDKARRVADALVQAEAVWNGLQDSANQLLNECANKLQKAKQDAQTQLTQIQNTFCANTIGALSQALTHVLDLVVGGAKVSDYLSTELLDAIGKLKADLDTCSLLDGKTCRALELSTRRLGDLLARSLSIDGIGGLVNINKILTDLVAMMGIPTRVKVTYDWDTAIHEFPEGNGALFEPLDDKRLEIHALVEAGLGGGPVASMSANMSSFKINLFGKGSGNFLTLTMDRLVLTVPPNGKLACETKVLMVEPGPALGFVSNLAKSLGLDSNFIILPTFNGIKVGYEMYEEGKMLGGFFVQNLGFSISADLPFDNSPVRVAIKVGDKLKPFLISAGIYGGGGFLGIRTRADTLEILEASFEYGVVAGFTFGVLKGAGRITAGVYIRIGGRMPVIEGFFCAVGEVSLAGIFNAGASLRVSLSYGIKSGNMSGVAEYEFHFSIGWFKYSYSINVDYVKSGDANQTQQSALEYSAVDAGRLIASGTSGDPADHPYSNAAWSTLWACTAAGNCTAADLKSTCTPCAALA
ncbi:hypothetical protein [Undibacterium sp. Ren11W]|uniref:hypothetical protein n=1 Tax=Undibacterium sp. Ren11W TaxID=3413045 RepID=UPI003BF1BD6B